MGSFDSKEAPTQDPRVIAVQDINDKARKANKQQDVTLVEDPSSVTITLKDDLEFVEFKVDKKIRVGCIGVGSRLRTLIRLLWAAHSSTIEFVAIADESQEALQECRSDFKLAGIPAIESFTNYRDLLAIGDIDWILVGSKNYQHKDHCIDAFKAGKHVFCEKPLAITMDQCEDILAAQKASGKLFSTGFVLRHAPLYKYIHKVVTEEKQLGKIITVEANETLYPAHGGYIFRNWRRFTEFAGPHILEKTCHDIDILSWLLDSVPTQVAAFGGTEIFVPENEPKDERTLRLYKQWPMAYEEVNPFTVEKSIEDHIVAIMQWRNGVKSTFHTTCNAAWPQRRILICGVNGTLEADLIKNQITMQVIGQHKSVLDVKASGAHGGGDYRIIDDLVRSMVEGSTPKATGAEGMKSAIICLAVDEARRNNEIIKLEPVWKRFGV